jgi:hypothetical protein
MRQWHGISAILIGLFLVLHIGNHLAGLQGQEYHIAYMEWARGFYRNPLIEPLILMLLAWQMGSGLFMFIRNLKQLQGGVAWLQAASGCYLFFFLVVHVTAVLYGRAFLHLDTNFYFAAAGFSVSPWKYFFAPYYCAAVLSVFTHIGCALYWNFPFSLIRYRSAALAATTVLGSLAGCAIVLSLAGVFYSVEIPSAYLNVYPR